MSWTAAEEPPRQTPDREVDARRLTWRTATTHARVVKWLWANAKNRFQGDVRSFED